jgi:UPF0755 protein
MQRVRRWLLPILLLCIASAGVLFFLGQRTLEQPGPLPEARTIVIPHGGVRSVATALEQAGAVGSETGFLIAAAITRGEGSLRAAELAFPAHASLRDVLTVLRTGRPVQHLLAIPEGLTATQIAALISRAEALSGPAEPPEEGSVLPETYAYEYGTAREAIIERARLAMDRALAKAWAERAPGLPLTSARDALILASIVERETARPEERAHIASVYLNRLRLGMKLQADPTVAYGVSGGTGVLDRALTRADLEHDDPYNTYRIRGLPAGPIASPGLASLNAVVQPDRNDDLYFVADGSGGHVFARTLEEHQRNIARSRSAGPAVARPG